jgi:hypothetical protein
MIRPVVVGASAAAIWFAGCWILLEVFSASDGPAGPLRDDLLGLLSRIGAAVLALLAGAIAPWSSEDWLISGSIVAVVLGLGLWTAAWGLGEGAQFLSHGYARPAVYIGGPVLALFASAIRRAASYE